jgi:hypothetical protein
LQPQKCFPNNLQVYMLNSCIHFSLIMRVIRIFSISSQYIILFAIFCVLTLRLFISMLGLSFEDITFWSTFSVFNLFLQAFWCKNYLHYRQCHVLFLCLCQSMISILSHVSLFLCFYSSKAILFLCHVPLGTAKITILQFWFMAK